MANLADLEIDSSLADLPLLDCQVGLNVSGSKVAQLFEADLSLPCVLVIQDRQLAGLVSRRRFHEQIGSPYGREIFFHRPISVFLEVSRQRRRADYLVVPGHTKVEAAVNLSLRRSSESVYEPIVVRVAAGDDRPSYYFLDFQTLLLAQSQILTLVNESVQQQWQQNRHYMLKLDEERQRAKQYATLLEKQQNIIRDRNHILETQQVALIQKNQEIAQLNERFVKISRILSLEGHKAFEITFAGVDGICANSAEILAVGQQLSAEVRTVQQASDMVARVSYQVRHLATKAAIVASHASSELSGFSQITEEISKLVNQTYQAGQQLDIVARRFEDRVQNLSTAANSGTTIARSLTQDIGRMQDAIAQLEELIQPLDTVDCPTTTADVLSAMASDMTVNRVRHLLERSPISQANQSSSPAQKNQDAHALLELLNQAETILSRIDQQPQGEATHKNVQQFRQKLAKTLRALS